MFARSTLALATTLALLAQPVMAQGARLDDQTLSAQLIGTWINSPDSPDYEGVTSTETFNADGTYIYREYTDDKCVAVLSSQTSKWYVWDGVIITQYPQGKELKDEVVSMESTRVVLRSLDDSLTFFRLKTTNCPKSVQK